MRAVLITVALLVAAGEAFAAEPSANQTTTARAADVIVLTVEGMT